MCELKAGLPNPAWDISFDQEIKRWDEALPLGNGQMGCLIWGNGNPLRFSLDRGDLWDNRPSPHISNPNFRYEKLVELVQSKKHEAVKDIFESPYNDITPTKIPAGKLYLDFGKKADSIASRLFLRHAQAQVRLRFANETAIVKSFLDATDSYGYIQITGTNQLPNLVLSIPDFGGVPVETDIPAVRQASISNGSLRQLHYEPPRQGRDGNISWILQKTAEGQVYCLLAASQVKCGCMEVVYTVAAGAEGGSWFEQAAQKAREGLEIGYDRRFSKHKRWWKEFWEKSSVQIPDPTFERNWYQTNYLFGSCSRKYSPPMPLQGVWTADNGELPPWKGDYHNDLNTQLSYLHYLKANHLEEGESFLDFLWDLVPAARQFAKDFYDAPGICLPSVMSLKGTALGGWTMYSYSMTTQIWLCQSFELYWRYTGDDTFLKTRAYPYFEETASCVLRWLAPDAQGKLRLPISSSPEIHENAPEAWLEPNSNFDLSMLRYLFKTLADMAIVLGNGQGPIWQRYLDSLHDLAVNQENELLLNPSEPLGESHRHHSHAIAIYPLRLLDYFGSEGDRAVVDATIASLEKLGTGLWTGFGFPWMAEFYAVQGNGEGAAFYLSLFWKNFCSPNGFHLNGDYKRRGVSWWHYRPFTLEANMCAADALQEMLLQNNAGILRIFAAIPEDWKRKRVGYSRLRGWNGILVSANMQGGRVTFVMLEATKDGLFKLQNCFKVDRLTITKNGLSMKIEYDMEGNLVIALNKEEKAVIMAQDYRD